MYLGDCTFHLSRVVSRHCKYAVDELIIVSHWRVDVFFQNAKASYDFSSNDPYPYPRYTDDWFNR